jgi:hypothetical protein
MYLSPARALLDKAGLPRLARKARLQSSLESFRTSRSGAENRFASPIHLLVFKNYYTIFASEFACGEIYE